MQKICFKCKHISIYRGMLPVPPMCGNPIAPISPVYGGGVLDCESARTYEKYCGPDGNWFEPKETPRKWWKIFQREG